MKWNPIDWWHSVIANVYWSCDAWFVSISLMGHPPCLCSHWISCTAPVEGYVSIRALANLVSFSWNTFFTTWGPTMCLVDGDDHVVQDDAGDSSRGKQFTRYRTALPGRFEKTWRWTCTTNYIILSAGYRCLSSSLSQAPADVWVYFQAPDEEITKLSWMQPSSRDVI